MDKLFYLVDIEVEKNREWIPLVNPPYLEYKLNILFEQPFWYDLRYKQNLFKELGKNYTLWSVSADKKTEFEKSCKELLIDVRPIDLSEPYADFCRRNAIYKPSPQEDIPAENQLEICSESVPHIICGPGTLQTLLEHEIAEKDKIKLYINSKENTHHNTPHCHVKYNGCNNYCSLSLIDYQKLAPDGKKENAVIKAAQKLLADNIQVARKKWNEIDAPLKFIFDNGKYTAETHKL